MFHRVPGMTFLPAAVLTVAVGCALAYPRLAPMPGEPVAAVFRPGLSASAAVGRLAGGWRLIGLSAAWSMPVLLLRQPAGAAEAAPAGAWLLLRASGAGLCLVVPP